MADRERSILCFNIIICPLSPEHKGRDSHGGENGEVSSERRHQKLGARLNARRIISACDKAVLKTITNQGA